MSEDTKTTAEHRPRFELASPLPTVPGVMLDTYTTGVGVAQQIAKARNVQARILWVDATANIERYNDEPKIVALVQQIRQSGFNTVVFDVKPISGQVVYNSKLAPKLTEWRGRKLPAEFDPLPIMVRECKANGLGIYASLNAFSEGHRMFLVGPGYNRMEQQTVLYEPKPVIRSLSGTWFPLSPKVDAPVTGAIAVYSTAEKLPAPDPAAFAVTVRRDGKVVDGFEFGGTAPGVPTVPRGGTILYGVGDAAAFLRTVSEPGYALQFDTEAEFVPISQRPEQQIPLMMNPNHPEVQRYALDIADELVRNYDIDGIVYDDRLRYGGINADFSTITRTLFEQHVGKPLQWPDDVFKFTWNPNMVRGIRPGRYYDQWMAWRAQRLRDFVQLVRHKVRTVKPQVQLGVYAGSWYGEYSAIGQNWASPDAEAGFWFQSPSYRKAGLASNVDFLITGSYYPTATIYDAMSRGVPIGNTIEASGTLTNRLVRDQTWSYAGIMLSDFKDNPEGLSDALQAAVAATQGVMVFDLSHDIDPMWPVFARAFAQPKQAPHANPALLTQVRQRRANLDKLGVKDPPIVIAAGAAGTGQ